jgi:hypothetical protein
MSRFDLEALLIDIKGIEKKLKLLLNQTCECIPPTVVIQSTASSICASGTATLTTEAQQCVTLQWQVETETGWENVTGETGTELVVTPETTSVFRILASNGRCTGPSNEITITVVEASHSVFSAADAGTVCDGGSTTLRLEVLGCAGVLTYQWQEEIAAVWTDIEGATSIDYTTPSLLIGEATARTYRVIVFCDGCGVSGDPLVIEVIEDPILNVTADGPATICDGGTIYGLVEVSGGLIGAELYQWQELVGDEWVDIPGAESQVLERTSLTTGTYTYRATVTQGSGCTAVSVGLDITVLPDPTVSIIAADETIGVGGEFELSSTALGGTGTTTYQWQRFVGGVWEDVFAEKGATMNNTTLAAPLSGNNPDLNPIAAGEYPFRLLIAQDSGCEAYSNEVIITVT